MHKIHLHFPGLSEILKSHLPTICSQDLSSASNLKTLIKTRAQSDDVQAEHRQKYLAPTYHNLFAGFPMSRCHAGDTLVNTCQNSTPTFTSCHPLETPLVLWWMCGFSPNSSVRQIPSRHMSITRCCRSFAGQAAGCVSTTGCSQRSTLKWL